MEDEDREEFKNFPWREFKGEVFRGAKRSSSEGHKSQLLNRAFPTEQGSEEKAA
jgi:hypothetical protein